MDPEEARKENTFWFTDTQEKAISYTVRVASGISMVGCLFVFVTFLGSDRFRKPVNRLLFYACIGNFFMAVACMISFAGINSGRDNALCQAQGFLVQWFFPADAVWNLAMAINVYLTIFKHFDARRLRRLEWLYNTVSYGLTFIVALAYCFVSTPDRGKMYGPAVLYCWVSSGWDEFRFALCYGPAWFAIAASIIIYTAAGTSIYRKRRQLRFFRGRSTVNRKSSFRPHFGRQPSEAQRAVTPIQSINKITEVYTSYCLRNIDMGEQGMDHGQTSARIEAGSPTTTYEPVHPSISAMPTNKTSNTQANSSVKANAAALRYTKVALLFFLCMMITWIPSSVFRLSSKVHPDNHSFGLTYVAGLVIPLQGFWNFIIYVVTSWDAVQDWVIEDLFHGTRNQSSRPTSAMRKSHSSTQTSTESTRAGKFMRLGSKSENTHLQPPNATASPYELSKWSDMPYWGQSRERSPDALVVNSSSGEALPSDAVETISELPSKPGT